MAVDASQARLCTEALYLLKQMTPMTTMTTTDSSIPAHRLCAAFLPGLMRSALRAHDWPFARATVPVAGMTPSPSDCVRVLRVEDCAGMSVPWTMADGMIRACLDERIPMRLVYTRVVDDVDAWDPQARSYLRALLCADLSEPLTGRLNEWQRYSGEANRALLAAKLAAQRERYELSSAWSGEGLAVCGARKRRH